MTDRHDPCYFTSIKIDPELEQFRTEKFEKSKEGVIRLWQRADIDWDRLVINFRFGNKKEAQEWFRNKIEACRVI